MSDADEAKKILREAFAIRGPSGAVIGGTWDTDKFVDAIMAAVRENDPHDVEGSITRLEKKLTEERTAHTLTKAAHQETISKYESVVRVSNERLDLIFKERTDHAATKERLASAERAMRCIGTGVTWMAQITEHFTKYPDGKS